MWVRSQDKNRLIETTNFKIEAKSEYNKYNQYGTDYTKPTIRYNIVSLDNILATYSTKEKALKVFDMIQENVGKAEIIFQMPQDDEV